MNDDFDDAYGPRVNAGGAGAMGLVALFAIVVSAAFSAGAALVAGAVVVALVRLVAPHTVPTYGAAYRATFVASMALIAVTAFTMWVIPSHMQDSLNALYVRYAQPEILPQLGVVDWPKALLDAMLVAVAGLAAYALVLSSKLGPPFSGVAGFALAFGVAVPAVVLSGASVIAFCSVAADRVASRGIHASTFMTPVLYLALFVFLFALAGALLAAIVLLAVSRLERRDTGSRYARAYGAAFVALVVHLIVSTVVVFLLPDSAPLFELISALARHRETASLLALLADPRWNDAWVQLAWVQLPGALLAAAIVAARLRESYEGAIGYARALIATAFSLTVPLAAAAVAVVVLIEGDAINRDTAELSASSPSWQTPSSTSKVPRLAARPQRP